MDPDVPPAVLTSRVKLQTNEVVSNNGYADWFALLRGRGQIT